MIIEAVRLVVTLATTAAGFAVGRASPEWFEAGGPSPDAAAVVGAVLGAGIGYVAGGLLGRFIRRSVDHAPDLVAKATGPQLFAGAFGLIAGLLVGAVMAVPAILLLPPVVGWPGAALLVIVLAAFGSSIFSTRADDLLAAAGLGRRRGRPASADEQPAPGSFVIDSSAAIDGRILDLARAGLVSGSVWLPGFVIDEIQGIADSGQKERRRRGRRGLDVLDALAELPSIDLRADERTFPEFSEVDAKLLSLCAEAEATLVTTDHNLAKAAELRGTKVLNPHALGESLRPGLESGDVVDIHIEREGSEPGQGIGFLDDGTMVVIEGAAPFIGEKVQVEVANALRTSVGRMLFAKMEE
ncbi:MAG: TRAM domain-containing protein [Acidimicrobiia bacterium]